MKHRIKQYMLPALCAALACVLVSGCRQNATQDSGGSPAGQARLQLDTLTVEFCPSGNPDALLDLAARMPDRLTAALADAGVEVGAIQVTLGASPAATAQAVGTGGVDLAFLPAEAYVEVAAGGVPLLANAMPVDQNERLENTQAGQSAMLCASPSSYGQSLARRAALGNTLTWDELNRAQWGVLDAASDLGYRYLTLWVADNYEGRDLTNLSKVRTYASYGELLRAAAVEEIDLFPCTQEVLVDWTDAWTLERTRADEAGHLGLGRPKPLAEELPILASTEACVSSLAVVRDDAHLTDPVFTAALQQALAIPDENDVLFALTGTGSFAPLPDGALDALRRLLTLEGVTESLC